MSAESPTPPHPMTATRSPGRTPAVRHTAPTPVVTAHPTRAATSNGTSVRDRDARALGDDAGLGEGREEGVVEDGLAVAGEPWRPVHEPSRPHRRPHRRAQLGKVSPALLALAAPGRPGQRDVVADAHARHALADGLDDPRALVSEHARTGVLGRPVDRVPVGVADAARVETDEDLLRPGRREVELTRGERSACGLENDGPDLHTAAVSFCCSRRSSSIGMWQRIWWPVVDLDEWGLCLLADGAELAWAPRVEDAARRRRRRARDVTFEPDPVATPAVDRRHRREEGLGVRVMRAVEHDVCRAELLQPTEIENGDPVRDVADDAEIVRDEEVRDLLLRLQLDEEVEDRRLDGDVERGGRLVADDELRVARERTRDRDSLLQARPRAAPASASASAQSDGHGRRARASALRRPSRRHRRASSSSAAGSVAPSAAG